jgi:hypothetical protein
MNFSDLIGMDIFNAAGFGGLAFRFFFNLIVIYIIARLIYYKLRQNRDYLFTLFIFNLVVFFVCYLLSSAKISIGFAFGVFAIFSILRYRTTTVPIKEMTYMFISLSVAIINSLTAGSISFAELLFPNIALISFAFVLEKTWVKNEYKREVLYEKIDLIKPENYDQLIEDLRERTGLKIHRAEVGKIDFLRDVAQIKIFYFEDEKVNRYN